jgi:hypothetical protein
MQVARPAIRTRGHTHVPSSPPPPAKANSRRNEHLGEAVLTVPGPRDRRRCATHWSGCSRWRSPLSWPAAGRSRRSVSGPPRPQLATWPPLESPAVAPRTNQRCANCSRTDAEALDWAPGVWSGREASPSEQRRVIAIDGKTIQGSGTRSPQPVERRGKLTVGHCRGARILTAAPLRSAEPVTGCAGPWLRWARRRVHRSGTRRSLPRYG